MPESARRMAVSGVADEVLMERYVGGDPAAFDELFRRYEPRAFSYFLRRTGSPDRAQDLYQDLFLRIHRARDIYDSRRPFSPWFFQIAHRLLIDDQRRISRSQELSIEDRPQDAIAAPSRDVSQRDELEQLLEGLSADERYVLVRSKGEGVGYAELASQLGRSIDAVKQMASRATRRLRTSYAGSVVLHGS